MQEDNVSYVFEQDTPATNWAFSFSDRNSLKKEPMKSALRPKKKMMLLHKRQIHTYRYNIKQNQIKIVVIAYLRHKRPLKLIRKRWCFYIWKFETSGLVKLLSKPYLRLIQKWGACLLISLSLLPSVSPINWFMWLWRRGEWRNRWGIYTVWS